MLRAVLVGWLLAFPAVAATLAPPGTFQGYVTVSSVDANPLSGTHTTTVALGPDPPATVTIVWTKPGSTGTRSSRVLNPAEAARLVVLLRAADLFRDQGRGTDERYIDRSFRTLTVDDDGRITTLVISGNETFKRLNRGALMTHLFLIAAGDRARELCPQVPEACAK